MGGKYWGTKMEEIEETKRERGVGEGERILERSMLVEKSGGV